MGNRVAELAALVDGAGRLGRAVTADAAGKGELLEEAAFDNPDLLVAVAVADGEAETGSLATSWHSNKFLNPVPDGAVLPILHLNGYKINNPTLLSRIPGEELANLMRGYGWTPHFVEGDDPMVLYQEMAATLDRCMAETRTIQGEARASGKAVRAHWPMILLRTPKGWTGPKTVDGHKMEGFWRAHQVPLAGIHENPEHLKQLNTPLELAINNEIDRFSLAIDVINRLPHLQVAGAHVKEKLRDMQIECRNHAYTYGIDKPNVADWTWPF
jgi:phosphoketolase